MKLRSGLEIYRGIGEKLIWLLYVITKPSDVKFFRYGNCRFLGQENFIKVAKEAIEEIKRLDLDLYEDLSRTKVTYIQTIHGFKPWERINKRYIMYENMLTSHIHYFVYATIIPYFIEKNLLEYGRLRHRFFYPPLGNTMGLSAAKEWLILHQFDQTYIDSIQTMLDKVDAAENYANKT